MGTTNAEGASEGPKGADYIGSYNTRSTATEKIYLDTRCDLTMCPSTLFSNRMRTRLRQPRDSNSKSSRRPLHATTCERVLLRQKHDRTPRRR